MGWFLLIVVCVFVYYGYKKSEKENFFYMGPDKDKYDNAFIGILLKG